jgi:3-oxoacyl-[acyl-carrier protein] reductase
MDLGLNDASAVVVGGGRGMGLAAARCLAGDGARVALVGRTADVLDKAAKDLTDRGSPDALGLVADTGDAEAVQRVFDKLSDRWDGELNILINAVGPGTQGTFDDLTDDQWREAFDDGVMGMVHCVRSALPCSARRGGHASSTSRRTRHNGRASSFPRTRPPRRR